MDKRIEISDFFSTKPKPPFFAVNSTNFVFLSGFIKGEYIANGTGSFV